MKSMQLIFESQDIGTKNIACRIGAELTDLLYQSD
jgi:hypothetical protein